MADITSPFDPTVDSPAGSLLVGPAGSVPPHPAAVAMVEGSGPELSAEMQQVLRWRLRIAALVLFGGFAVFLVYRTVSRDWAQPATRTLFIVQAAVTLLLGLMGGSMCRKCPMTMRILRVDELLIFGAPAVFFVLMQWFWATKCAAEHQLIPALVGPWFMLMFTYAMFIPNTWRRAAVVLAGMAAIPLALMVALWIGDTACAALFTDRPGWFIEQALLLTIAAVACTVGTYTIGSLRREAFEARQLGQYRLKQLIGAGGMGEVHLAEHQMMKRPCAIKLIHPDKAGDPRILARFEREVRATAKLSHWNTIEIFDYGRTDDGAFYYVMEYLPGLNLAELVQRFGPIEPARVVYLLRQVCDALTEAHAMGLIHRDIKPGNIFAAHRGGVYDVAKLLDFGLVKPVSEGEDPHLTLAGSITGSPLFMSPEQAVGEDEADERSDIYSLGACAYFLLTGQPPFAESRPLKAILAHARDEVVPPSRHRDRIPDDLEAVVLRCLNKQPADRYSSAEKLRNALDKCSTASDWNRERARGWWQNRDRSGFTPTSEAEVSPGVVQH